MVPSGPLSQRIPCDRRSGHIVFVFGRYAKARLLYFTPIAKAQGIKRHLQQATWLVVARLEPH